MEEEYEVLRDIGSGNCGVAKLVRDRCSGQLFAVKYIERGKKIDEHVQREIMNHRSLKHPNIIGFKKVLLTPTHLAIVMEYAAGGELFDRICSAGRFGEDERHVRKIWQEGKPILTLFVEPSGLQHNNARYYFHQLISGVSYCHSMQICHRDLKLENILVDGNTPPLLKICDFGYSKSSRFHSQPKSTVGTPAYIAPEVLSKNVYDGKIADVWSCGVTLYVMLVGAYPFEDPDEPKNFKRTLQRIINAHYSIPAYVRISSECKQLLSQIFVANPEKRITIPGIMQHPWFLKNLGKELYEEQGKTLQCDDEDGGCSQSVEEIMLIFREAQKPGEGANDRVLDVYYETDIDTEEDSTDDFVSKF